MNSNDGENSTTGSNVNIHSYLTNSTVDSLYLYEVHNNGIENLIKQLDVKRSIDIDNIPPKLLRQES